MKGRVRSIVTAGVAASLLLAIPAGSLAQEETAPVVAVETEKGTFTFETFPEEAPLTVAHVVALVRSRFYDGMRVHRAIPGFVVQFGDPQTRDLAKRELWGKGTAASSGHAIGAGEASAKRTNTKGAVGIAHLANPADADSQIYITLDDRRDLDGQYTVFGHLIEGDDVVSSLQIGDEIRRAYIREP